jgi:RNA polymerase sigma factor (sigma-70 family)
MNHQRKSVLAEFVRCNYSRLVDYVRGMIDDSAHRSSEDVVQDVILKILDRPDILAPITDLSAYIFRALRNRVIDHYRSPDRGTVSLDREDENGLSLFDVIPDSRYNPEDSYNRCAQYRLVFGLIRELPPSQMEIIVETEFNGRTFRELSRHWGIPLGTLLARKSRGIRTIREKLLKLQEVKE